MYNVSSFIVYHHHGMFSRCTEELAAEKATIYTCILPSGPHVHSCLCQVDPSLLRRLLVVYYLHAAITTHLYKVSWQRFKFSRALF